MNRSHLGQCPICVKGYKIKPYFRETSNDPEIDMYFFYECPDCGMPLRLPWRDNHVYRAQEALDMAKLPYRPHSRYSRKKRTDGKRKES